MRATSEIATSHVFLRFISSALSCLDWLFDSLIWSFSRILPSFVGTR